MSEKILRKWLKGRRESKNPALAILPVAGILLLAASVLSFLSTSRAQPEQYSRQLERRAYCCMDVQYMTEQFAIYDEGGNFEEKYCYAAYKDFNWLCVRMSDEEYARFAELVDFTYDLEDNTPPDTIRIEGTLQVMDMDLYGLAKEYYDEMLSTGEYDSTSLKYLDFGTNPGHFTSILLLVLGGAALVVGLILMAENADNSRAKNARKTIAQLKKSGQLQAAMDDLRGDGILTIADSLEPSGGNVLGEQFIFAFTSGRILRYSDVKRLSLSTTRCGTVTRSILNVHDAGESALPVAHEKLDPSGSSADGIISKAAAHIRKRNPDVQL